MAQQRAAAGRDSAYTMQQPVFDKQAALVRLGNDQELWRSILDFFLEDYPALLARVHSSIERRDVRELTLAAHSLKGLVANFDAHAAMRAAAQMEKAGQDHDMELIDKSLAPLDDELARLKDALLAYRGECR